MKKLLMSQRLTQSRLANQGAYAIYKAFDTFHAQFKIITERAQRHFANRGWNDMHHDADERLGLYKQTVDEVVCEIRLLLADRIYKKLVWASIKAVYSGMIAVRDDWELAETFF